MGKAVKTVAKVGMAPVTGGASLLGGGGGMKDLLFGKKDVGTADRFLELDPDIRRTQMLARKTQRDMLSKLAKVDPRDKTEFMVAQAQKANQGAFRDQQQRIRDMVARRGLGKSSIGLAQQLGASLE